jgi:hypothetical protein
LNKKRRSCLLPHAHSMLLTATRPLHLRWAGFIILTLLLPQPASSFHPPSTMDKAKMMRRSSSLGEESHHDHYSTTAAAKQSWRRRVDMTKLQAASTSSTTTRASIYLWSHCGYSICTHSGRTFLFRSTTILSSFVGSSQTCRHTLSRRPSQFSAESGRCH